MYFSWNGRKLLAFPMSQMLVVSMHIHNRDLELWVPMEELHASQMWQVVKHRVLEDKM